MAVGLREIAKHSPGERIDLLGVRRERSLTGAGCGRSGRAFLPDALRLLLGAPAARQTGAALKDGLREVPGFIAFALEDGIVYHTYTVTAPDPFVAPYHAALLQRTPKPGPDVPRAWRKDEYPS